MQTLNDLLHVFVHERGYDPPGPQNRRDWAAAIADKVLERRQPIHRVYLPLVLRNF
jgi:hypothetical protein